MATLTKRCRHRGAEREACSCSWYVRRTVNGREVIVNVGSSKALAEQAFAALTGEDPRGERLSKRFSDCAARFLLKKEADPGHHDNSLDTWRSRINIINESFGPLPVTVIDGRLLRRFADRHLAEGRKPNTVKGLYSTATAVLRHARAEGLIRVVPVPDEGHGIPQPPMPQRRFSIADLNRVIEACESPAREVAEFILLTGLRWSELLAVLPEKSHGRVLRIESGVSRRGTVSGPKTRSSTRSLALDLRADELLKLIRVQNADDPLRYKPIHRQVQRAFAQEGVTGNRLGLHTFRHAHRSLLEAAGLSLREQAARMGHSTKYAVTLGYGLDSATVVDLDAVRRSL